MSSRLHQRPARDALFSNYDPSSSTSSNNRSSNRTASASASPAYPSSKSFPQKSNGGYSIQNSNSSNPYSLNSTPQPKDYSNSYGYGLGAPSTNGGGGFSAYPSGSSSSEYGVSRKSQDDGFRSATPDGRGRYANAVYDELESQNDEQVSVMTAKVKMLKNITIAIGDEIRDSTAFAEKMNEGFEGTRNRLRGTMNRMVRMAERTRVGWRVWLGFLAFVGLVFVYVWLF